MDEFVEQGVTLVVLGQQRGYEYAILPVPQEPDGMVPTVSGGSWQEDISCFSNSTYIETWHQMLAGQGRSTPLPRSTSTGTLPITPPPARSCCAAR